MKRLAVLATVVVQVLAVAGVAMATPIPGPTPSGTGAYAYCNVNTKKNPSSRQTSARCTYGIPVDGATLARVEFHYGADGWYSFASSGGVQPPGAPSGCGSTLPSIAAGEYTAAQCIGGDRFAPDERGSCTRTAL